MNTAVQIGGVTQQAMDIAAETIVKVATCSPVPEVAIKALDVLIRLGSPPTSFNDCSFNMAPLPVVGSDHHFDKDDPS